MYRVSKERRQCKSGLEKGRQIEGIEREGEGDRVTETRGRETEIT